MNADWKRKRPLTDTRCPACKKGFAVPVKGHPVKADIRCPHCREMLAVEMGGICPKIVAKSAI